MYKIILLSILFLLKPIYELAAQCDPGLKASSTEGKLKYMSRDKGRYCEGFYTSKVSANELVLVSFTKGPLTYSSEKPQLLQLSTSSTITGPVNIRANGIPFDLYYRMDLLLNPKEVFQWNTEQVLLKNERTKYARLIGLLGFKEKAKRKKEYVAVHIDAPADDRPYLMQFIASTRITQCKWRIVGHTKEIPLNSGRAIRRGKVIKIVLPKDLPEGQHILEIKGREAKNGIRPIANSITFRI